MKLYKKLFEELPLVFLLLVFFAVAGALFYYKGTTDIDLVYAKVICAGGQECDYCRPGTGVNSNDYFCVIGACDTAVCGTSCCWWAQSCSTSGKCCSACSSTCPNGSCTGSGPNFTCHDGKCECIDNSGDTCASKGLECGHFTDKCGKPVDCGSALEKCVPRLGKNAECLDGKCVCTNWCASKGRECGDNGCNGTCGDCVAKYGAGSTCDERFGLCNECEVDCEGKKCGDDDSCNGTCLGACGPALKCIILCPDGMLSDPFDPVYKTCDRSKKDSSIGVGGSGYHALALRAESRCRTTDTGGYYCGGTRETPFADTWEWNSGDTVYKYTPKDKTYYNWLPISDCGETRVDNGRFCLQNNVVNSTTTHGCTTGGTDGVPVGGDNGIACTEHNYVGAVDICGMHGDAKTVCEGSKIVTYTSQYVCAANSASKTASCVVGGMSKFEMDCGPPSDSKFTFCSKGTLCTIEAKNPGKCFYKDATTMPCICNEGKLAACDLSGQCICLGRDTPSNGITPPNIIACPVDGGVLACECPVNKIPSCGANGQCICSNKPTGVSQVNCTSGSQVGGCEPPEFKMSCSGTCKDGGDGTDDDDADDNPDDDDEGEDCEPGATQDCLGGKTQQCNPDGTWGECVDCTPGATQTCLETGTQKCDPDGSWAECECPDGQTSPSYECISGACRISYSCGLPRSECDSNSCVPPTTSPRPVARNLVVASAPYCAPMSGTGLATFTWNYVPGSDRALQTAWQMQIGTDSAFSNIIFDSGKQNNKNNQEQLPVLPAFYTGSDPHLTYGADYYWRVKVWSTTNASLGWTTYKTSSDVQKFTYGYAHPAPNIMYAVPENIYVNEPVVFKDLSICYHNDGSQYNCKDLLVNSTLPANPPSIACNGVDYNLLSNMDNCYGWWLNSNYRPSATAFPNAIDWGSVKVTATAADGSEVIATKYITVVANDSNAETTSSLVNSIDITTEGSVSGVAVGESLQMFATVLPATAANKNVTWSVNNSTGSAIIDSSSGLLTATGVGIVEVTATSVDGSNKSRMEKLNLTESYTGGGPITKITVKSTGAASRVVTGQTLQMNAVIEPSNADIQAVTWSVAPSFPFSTGIATINPSTGLLTAGPVGQASFTYNSLATKTTTLQVCDEIGCCLASKNITPNNKPPSASELTARPEKDGSYCDDDGNIVKFSWTFVPTASSTATQQYYQLQISALSDFSALAYDSGKVSDTNSWETLPVYGSSYEASDSHIHYGEGYYWRVRVWSTTASEPVSEWAEYIDASGYQAPYTYDYPHKAPEVSAIAEPATAVAGETINFTNTSKCYNNAGEEQFCEDLDNIHYEWSFGDNSPVHLSDTTGNVSHAYSPDSSKAYPFTYSSHLSVCDYANFCCEGDTPINVTIGGNDKPVIDCPIPNFMCGTNCCIYGQVCRNERCENDDCVFPNFTCGYRCCSSGQVCLNGQCADNGDSCIAPKFMCGDNCCNSGQICMNGLCANDDSCIAPRFMCGTNCCIYGQICLNGQCASNHCTPPETVCNSGCCNSDEICSMNGVCIPKDIIPSPISINESALYCSGANIAAFRWGYQDAENDIEKSWHLQISKTDVFSEDSVVFDDIQSYDGVNADTVPVSFNTCNAKAERNCIKYSTPYYVRVQVTEQEKGTTSYQNSDWYYYGTSVSGKHDTYTYPFPHPAPVMSYVYSTKGLAVTMKDTSICYKSDGKQYSCKDLATNSIKWDFGSGYGTSASYTYSSAGLHEIKLQVCDDSKICCEIKDYIDLSAGGNGAPLWKEISPFK